MLAGVFCFFDMCSSKLATPEAASSWPVQQDLQPFRVGDMLHVPKKVDPKLRPGPCDWSTSTAVSRLADRRGRGGGEELGVGRSPCAGGACRPTPMPAAARV